MLLPDACPDSGTGCSACYFLWKENQWKLVYRSRLEN